MGLFDDISIEAGTDAPDACPYCGDPVTEYQTKSLECAMDHYTLRLDDGAARLFKLGEPDDKYWTPTTDEERQAFVDDVAGTFMANWPPPKGHYAPEAFLSENRTQRSMGELPHQWVRITGRCNACDIYLTYELKFTDGVLTAVLPIDDD